ncbi:16S rRNA (guanine(966)-N(2))-methyltransferase RsmD [Pseudoduganella sp. FT25W]|jgi:16S rRNA (guanine(966)-N(2))-methyltransferase RsmD|uniref:16S rRNA (Guanine(966)-N(2))-methyltransferase RsmD n=1 Tax=Duganella alba TaxID=2666081 RepID=A0A6L5QBX4_9BURK|nr:16S rRNA (guanine(966)-N(2))-methyltransferase RsmD [Duganella alba]MRX07008.1 16S rRNA (guanine(966)-N(2))-methyltransferase RsmD [Duganella alba]MRX16095.1 16S rRNA (guanine(966)-N(2))-methyltransferase RsmD [Duganella alba]
MPKKPASKPARSAKVPVHGPQHSNQVRIIGGQWKRTPLPVLSALGLRPTPDRVRETAFNWINHLRDANWAGAQVLDLFAGSGALGFEAASRGAASVSMIDSNAQVVRQLDEIKTKLKADNVQIMRGDALAVAQSAAARGQKYDLIFLDPPYQQTFLERALPLCTKILKDGGLIYAESGLALEFAEGEAPEWLANWEIIRADKAGMVFYHLLKYKP